MKNPTTQEIEALLMNILSDGFNRSFGALRATNCIDEQKLAEKYKGAGSEYYDLITAQIELTAKYAAPKYKGAGSEYYDLVTAQIELTAKYAAPAVRALFLDQEC